MQQLCYYASSNPSFVCIVVMRSKWLPLEANPEVIARYCHTLGGPENIQFVDILSVEDWALKDVPRPVLAVMLLFVVKDKEAKGVENPKSEGDSLWFVKQTISNACGTISLLHTVYNLPEEFPLAKGKFFDTLLQATKSKTPEERAKALENDSSIEAAHLEAEKEGQSRVPQPDENIDTHFVTFVPKDGSIYELDGRHGNPIKWGKTAKGSFLEDVVALIKKEYMAKDPEEVRFSLIAVTSKKP